MAEYEINNWWKYQHYKDRCPPWIKLHFELLASEDWVTLSDASRVLAVACMLVASRSGGRIDASTKGLRYLERVAYLNSPADLNPLVECGFLNLLADASTMQADATQEEEGEEEKEEEKKGTEYPNGTTAPEVIPKESPIENNSKEEAGRFVPPTMLDDDRSTNPKPAKQTPTQLVRNLAEERGVPWTQITDRAGGEPPWETPTIDSLVAWLKPKPKLPGPEADRRRAARQHTPPRDGPTHVAAIAHDAIGNLNPEHDHATRS